MPEIVDRFKPRGGQRAPSAVDDTRLGMAAQGESIQSANVNQAQGATALAVDRPVVDADIAKRRADSSKAQTDALEASVRSRTPGGFATAEERATAYNYKRLLESEKQTLGALQKDPSAAKAPFWPEITEKIPLPGADILSNVITDPERRIVKANQLDMLDAALYLATGAAYNKEQLVNTARSYFPQVGDDAATIKAKRDKLMALTRAAKERAAMGLAAPGGPAGPAGARGAAGASGPQIKLPPEAVAKLRPGQVTTFGNGQKWTLRNGLPARVP